jgi:predicted ester cyclase
MGSDDGVGSAVGGAADSPAKAVVRRFYEEVFDRRRLEAIDELYAADCVRHAFAGPPRDNAWHKRQVAELRAGFPDWRVSLDALIGEGDLVAARWTFRGTHTAPLRGIAPTGKEGRLQGITLFRVAGGRIVETWNSLASPPLADQVGGAAGGQAG